MVVCSLILDVPEAFEIDFFKDFEKVWKPRKLQFSLPKIINFEIIWNLSVYVHEMYSMLKRSDWCWNCNESLPMSCLPGRGMSFSQIFQVRRQWFGHAAIFLSHLWPHSLQKSKSEWPSWRLTCTLLRLPNLILDLNHSNFLNNSNTNNKTMCHILFLLIVLCYAVHSLWLRVC